MSIRDIADDLASVSKIPIKQATRPSDADYHSRVEAALQATCRADYPAGMVGWLENGDPALYEELTIRLPDLIHRLWEAHAPLDEFEHIVGAWLAAHERACVLYRAELSRRKDGKGQI